MDKGNTSSDHRFTGVLFLHSDPVLASPYLHLLNNLLSERAHLGGARDGHVLGALVLTGDAVERAALILDVAV